MIPGLLRRSSGSRWKAAPTISMRVEPILRWRGVSDRSTFSLCHWRWERATLTEERLHPGDRGEGRGGEDGGREGEGAEQMVRERG